MQAPASGPDSDQILRQRCQRVLVRSPQSPLAGAAAVQLPPGVHQERRRRVPTLIGLDDESLQHHPPARGCAPAATAARSDALEETPRPAVLREDKGSAAAAAYRAKVEEILVSDIFSAIRPNDEKSAQPASLSHQPS